MITIPGNGVPGIIRDIKDVGYVIGSYFGVDNYRNMFGKRFRIDEMQYTLDEVAKEYMLFDLRPTDTVLDIGAGIGAFSLMVCDHCKHVYAVEPLYYNELLQNMDNNHTDVPLPITVIKNCLGENENVEHIGFSWKKRDVVCISLRDMIKLSGNHVDFIKCDCEGGEWYIKPEELSGVRRIEMEYHVFKNGKHDRVSMENMLKAAGFDYVIDNVNCSPFNRNMVETGIIHAWRT